MSKNKLSEQGLTLVEMMVALALSSLIMIFVLGVHSRLNAAYHGQTVMSNMSNSMRASRTRLVTDIKQAGYLFPDGLKFASAPTTVVPGISVTNDADGDGPDSITVYYADPGSMARVTAIQATSRQFATVSDGSLFVGYTGLAVIVNPRLEGGSDTDSPTPHADACVVKITSVAGTTINFATSAPWNTATNAQCDVVETALLAEGSDTDTVIYALVGRSYRIDPTPARQQAGILQMMELGPTSPTWSDLSVGVVNLQIATQYSEPANLVDLDGDGDPTLDWYSGESQETADTTERPLNSTPVSIGLSLEVKSQNEVTGAASLVSAELTDPTSPETLEHNSLGDWESIDLQNTLDTNRPLRYRGNYLFRSVSTTIDLRNIGVGL